MKKITLNRLFASCLIIAGVSIAIRVSADCWWIQGTLQGCGTPAQATPPDCQGIEFSPSVVTECCTNSVGATDCNPENVDLTMTVNYFTNYGDHCGLPYYSKDYDAGTCQQAVLSGDQCGGG